MAREIIVNVGERETRIAVLDDGRIVELQVERTERVVGSLYKARVANVVPGMDAAFVDIGLERNAYLAVGDVLPTAEDGIGRMNDEIRAAEGRSYGRDARPGRRGSRRGERGPAQGDAVADGDGGRAEEADADGHADRTTEVEDVVIDTDETGFASLADAEVAEDLDIHDEPGDAEDADPDEDEESDGDDEADPAADNRREGRGRRVPGRHRGRSVRSVLRMQNIGDVLKVGQELLVQVTKGPRSTKGARVSTRISLPGRYLVLMPEGNTLGVSRKIESADERDRLKKIGDRLRESGFGLIIRTEAEDKTEEELAQDMDFLMQTWANVQATAKRVRAPYVVQQDLTLLYQTIRDTFGSDVSRLVIDDPAEYEKASELVDRLSPRLSSRVELYDGVQPVFDKYGVEAEIDRLLRRKVFLKSGGSLVIDETEALCVIDVNTSKYTGGSNLAETILRINVEAAAEIARQMRLRDIGGIIVIDFIDMASSRDKQAVLKALETALKKDRSRTRIFNISPLGLVEMTRKRTGETLSGFLTDECPYCRGRGKLPSAETVSISLERDLRRLAADPRHSRSDACLVTCHPDVAELFIGPDGATVEELEREVERAIFVRADDACHVESYDIEPCQQSDLEKRLPLPRRSQVVDCRVARSLVKDPGKAIGWTQGRLVDLDDGVRAIGGTARVRITGARRSCLAGTVLGARSAG